MKRYSVLAAALTLGLLTCFGIALAQEEEELEYSWGVLSNVSSSQIVVTEDGYDTDEEIDVAYAVGPDVKLHNVGSLKDITVGDRVWIDYVIKKGKNVAVGIEVDKPSQKEEYAPLEAYEEESGYSEIETETSEFNFEEQD